MSMIIHSKAFENNEQIPAAYTCQGSDISPPLGWSGVPKEARSLALIVADPDFPSPATQQSTWAHWVLYDLPVTSTGLHEAVSELPAGTLQGVNDWKYAGYGGACPVTGRHRYFFKLYALDTVLPDLKTPTAATLQQAMQGHVIEEAHLVGTYLKAA